MSNVQENQDILGQNKKSDFKIKIRSFFRGGGTLKGSSSKNALFMLVASLFA